LKCHPPRKPPPAAACITGALLFAVLCAAPARSQQAAAPTAAPTDLQAEVTAAEHFFDHLDRASAAARLQQASARCTDQHQLDACDDALRLKPDDPALLIAQGDALMRAKRPADAIERYRLAAVIAPGENEVAAKLAAAEGRLQPAAADAPTPAESPTPLRAATGLGTPATLRRYSNAAPEAQSH
jgi:predicted Zn-dependent protease